MREERGGRGGHQKFSVIGKGVKVSIGLERKAGRNGERKKEGVGKQIGLR